MAAISAGLSVGLVLSDSSVVILALPAVLAEFDAEVSEVAGVITWFNLALALAAVPAAYASLRADPRLLAAGGLVAFAAASLACAAADSLDGLVWARVAQAVGGAFVVCAALRLLVTALDDQRRAAIWWASAGAIGAAVGPAAGGFLTQIFSWQSIFVVQAPLAVAAAVAVMRCPRPTRAGERPRGRGHLPDLAANAALALLSAALTGALFLLVLLLIEGWRLEPLAAAATVTAMPLAAVAIRFAPAWVRAPAPAALAGALLIAGGLGALALVPGARAGWTVPPQILIGAGLGLALQALTAVALARREPQEVHAGWTIASRHGGVVLGLLLLTPVFSADLEEQEVVAERAGAAAVLDADLPIGLKTQTGLAILRELERTTGQLPDLDPAFEAQRPSPDDQPAFERLRSDLDDEIQRAGTTAFRDSFRLAALLALGASLPALALWWRRSP